MSTRRADFGHAQPNSIAARAATSVSVDRLTRLKQVVEGEFAPLELPELADFLASPNGQVRYRITGNSLPDQSGRQQKRLQCIISGWFDVMDPVTLAPSRFELDIDSRVVVVASEDALPPLEDEADDEDYIVCGQDFDLKAHVQEEVLLAIPTTTPRSRALPETKLPKSLRRSPQSDVAVGDVQVNVEAEQSPFAKLAGLKKTR
ncbi:MAG: DUF177 domain-containing protein [Rhodocyclaceae bacterium]|nr:DUF177 domain-containing protein [Rhodocyclaceae bacterium]